jgi:hypothetical protein
MVNKQKPQSGIKQAALPQKRAPKYLIQTALQNNRKFRSNM